MSSGRARFMGLPRGSRDLLPPAARRRRELLGALLQAFDRWGYAQVVTPTVEYYDVLAEGLSDADRKLCVRFIEAHSGDVVALRADLTPQIARMLAGLRAAPSGVAWPDDAVARLCYAADVVRQPAGDREQTEYHQAGVELVGDPHPAADAELVALAHEALASAGLAQFRFDVSHRAVAGGVIDALELSADDRLALAQLLARKDRGSVVELLRVRGLDEPAIEATAALCDLYGPVAREAGVLERARKSLANATSARGLDELDAMLSQLRLVHPEAADAVDVDLGEVRGFDYYSGFRLRVWAPGVDRPVLRGGRYDDLLGRYGAPAPATGFAIDLDALETALPIDAGEPASPARVIAVHPGVDTTAGRLEAARRSAAARDEGERAWVQPAVELRRAQELAAWWGARALTFIEPDGDALRVASHRRSDNGWTRESK